MALFQSKTGFLTINQTQVYYEIAGEGQPLVLLHAGVADSRMWDEQFAAFAQQYRVVRYDLRGYGQSEAPARAFRAYEELAQLLQQLEIARAHIVGISYGGKIALDFALAYPKLVEKLVLVAPGISGSTPAPEVLKFYEEEEAALEAEDLDRATELNLQMWVDGPKRELGTVAATVRERVREMQRHAFDTVFPEGGVELDLEPPAVARLREVKAPTLVIVGDYDIQPMLEQARQLEAEIPGARLVVITDVAHMVNMEKPAEFNAEVLHFLS
ncbi:MAG: alpha/beta fold hydrolase [Ktedonobacteraceae bacterium]